MGHRADWKYCSVKLVDFLSRRLFSTFRWNGRGIVCLPSRILVFLKIKNKKKSRSGRKIGAVGDDKQLFFLLGLIIIIIIIIIVPLRLIHVLSSFFFFVVIQLSRRSWSILSRWARFAVISAGHVYRQSFLCPFLYALVKKGSATACDTWM